METEQDAERKETSSTQTPSPTFIGRTPLLDSIKQHLLKGQHVCLYGDRGIGKTAITEEVVRWLREDKPGLRVIHLADEMTFKNLLVQLARELHEGPAGAFARWPRYRGYSFATSSLSLSDSSSPPPIATPPVQA